MKKLIVTLSVLFLSSCALWDAHNMARFDNNEYYLINSITTNAILGKEHCGFLTVNKYVKKVWHKSNEFHNYSSAIPNNEETITMSGELIKITKGLNDKYDQENYISKAYCEAKFSIIIKNATTIQNVVGGKPR
jgi:hypothetical protein